MGPVLLLLLLPLLGLAAEDRLLFVTALWRHGERAPDQGSNPIYIDQIKFPYGISELTENGIVQSYFLGRMLRKRYVEEYPLLRRVLNPKEVYIQSVEVNRCLMTAEAVGQGMYNDDGRSAPLPVAVHSLPIDNDSQLAFRWFNCPALGEVFKGTCDKNNLPYPFPDITTVKNYADYETLSFHCSKSGINATRFNNVENFHRIESIIAKKKAGAFVDYDDVFYMEEAMNVYYRTIQYQLGVGEFFNPSILRLSTGNLLDHILKETLFKYKCFETRKGECAKADDVKMHAWSTQDFVLNGLMGALGIREEALGGVNLSPQYNALILIEVWMVKDEPAVKVFYRRSTNSTDLLDVSRFVRNCDSSPCKLQSFLHCCDNIRTGKNECGLKPSSNE